MKSIFPTLVIGALAVAIAPLASAAVETYAVDPAHSSVGFTVRNVVLKVFGTFTRFTATITLDRDNLEKSSAGAVIEIASVATGARDRDAHLQKPEFFDAAKFPQMTFKSTAWKKTAGGEFEITGDLSIKGITKPVVLKVKAPAFGPGGDAGSSTSDWEATTRINRHDFGVSDYPKVIGADVDITIRLKAVRKL